MELKWNLPYQQPELVRILEAGGEQGEEEYPLSVPFRLEHPHCAFLHKEKGSILYTQSGRLRSDRRIDELGNCVGKTHYASKPEHLKLLAVYLTDVEVVPSRLGQPETPYAVWLPSPLVMLTSQFVPINVLRKALAGDMHASAERCMKQARRIFRAQANCAAAAGAKYLIIPQSCPHTVGMSAADMHRLMQGVDLDQTKAARQLGFCEEDRVEAGIILAKEMAAI